MLKATWEDKEVVGTTESLERVTKSCANRSKKYDLECREKWYEHQPLPVIENDQVKLVWDSTVVTDVRVPHNSCSGAISFRGPRNSLERPPDEWMRPDDGLLGNGTYSQKGVASLS